MPGGLIGLIILVIVVGVILLIAQKIISLIPMDETFRQIAWLLIILVAILVVVAKALPLVTSNL